jgi:LysM repeat protein
MKLNAHRTAACVMAVLLVAVFGAGCTLTGANAAPLTPVVPTPSSGGQGQAGGVPSPTPIAPVDVFGTQTAMAPTLAPTIEIPPTDTPTPEEATPEPVIETPTPEVSSGGGTPAACPPTYTVQSGENLYRIALRFGLTYQALAAANGITNPDAIAAGAVLTIPGCGGSAGAGAGTGTSGGTGVQPAAGDTVADNGDILHTVQAGENLYRIAIRYSMTWQQLAQYNGITNPDSIVTGQVIRIPN